MRNNKPEFKKKQKGGGNNVNAEGGIFEIGIWSEFHRDVAHLFFAADSCHDSKKINKGENRAFYKSVISFRDALSFLNQDKADLFSQKFLDKATKNPSSLITGMTDKITFENHMKNFMNQYIYAYNTENQFLVYQNGKLPATEHGTLFILDSASVDQNFSSFYRINSALSLEIDRGFFTSQVSGMPKKKSDNALYPHEYQWLTSSRILHRSHGNRGVVYETLKSEEVTCDINYYHGFEIDSKIQMGTTIQVKISSSPIRLSFYSDLSPETELLTLPEAYSTNEMVNAYDEHFHSCDFCQNHETICPLGAAIFCGKIIGDFTYIIDMHLVPPSYPPVALVTADKICRSLGILFLQNAAENNYSSPVFIPDYGDTTSYWMINGKFETVEERNALHNISVAQDMQNTAAGARDLMAVRETHQIREMEEIIQRYQEYCGHLPGYGPGVLDKKTKKKPKKQPKKRRLKKKQGTLRKKSK